MSAGLESVFPVVVDGVLQPAGTPVLPAEDRGFQLGLAVFETLRVERGHPLFLAEHLERLVCGAGSAGIVWGDPHQASATVQRMIDAVQPSTFALRLTLSAGLRRPVLIATAREIGEVDPSGVRVRLMEQPVPMDKLANVKSTNRLRYTLAREEARAHGAHEALLLNTSGALAEGSVSNVFVVSGGFLSTPSLDQGCLGGLTRQRLLTTLRGRGLGEEEGGPLVPRERAVSRDELLLADEVLLTGSTSRVVGVRELDVPGNELRRLPGADGPVARALLGRLLELEALDRAAAPG